MMPVGRTADGTWQVGVRRTFACDAHTAWRLLPSLLDGDSAVGAIRSSTPDEVVRLGYRADGWKTDSILQLRVIPAVNGTTIAVHHERLPDAATREAMRERWASTLEALGRRLPGVFPMTQQP